ncbi:MAG: RidA family protein [Pseudomonadota bacterium]
MNRPHLSPAQRIGDAIHTSGQLAFDADGELKGDIAGQTTQVLNNLAAVLAVHGLTLADIGKTTVWLRRAEDFAAFNAAYAAAFGEHRPARSTVVAALAVAEALVEIEAIARHER